MRTLESEKKREDEHIRALMHTRKACEGEYLHFLRKLSSYTAFFAIDFQRVIDSLELHGDEA